MIILRFDTLIDHSHETRLLAMDGLTLVGMVDIEHVNRFSADFARLFVERTYRRKGVGKTLIEECCKIAKESGCQTIGCMVKKDNEDAMDFYKACGFHFAWEFDDESGDKVMVKVL